jgi:PAS domain S-box-containing protein
MASIPSILVVVDGHDRITHWNAAAEARLGLPDGRVLGRPLAEAGIDWDWSTVGAGIAQCRSTRSPVQLHDVRVRRAGQAGFLAITITPIQSATGTRDLLIVADAAADGSVS